MNDDEFRKLLDGYLEPPADPNPAMAGIELRWIRGDPDVGSLHMLNEHNVTEEEGEEVLFTVPPDVEAKRHRDYPNRTIFWGATRFDRWLFVVCEDVVEEGRRVLVPITAFEPDEGRAYWERQ